jgi:two-component system CheB/CheR fusion protein
MASSAESPPDPERTVSDPRDPAFERLLDYLKESRAFDFTGYKRASLMRRVRHQMQQVAIETFDEYHDYLQVHPDEFTALFNTILINVTGFFRDQEAWAYLSESALPRLLESMRDDAPIRIWSAGCATGQETYSLAMTLVDAIGPAAFRKRVKIYGTDVDEEALTVARQATYSDKEVRTLPEGYLERYFEAVNGRWAFRKELRRNLIFGRNDMVQDAPISRIDLLACRNALMYFNAETQSRIVSRLGFALRPEGILFLGKAEMLLNHTAIFEPLDLKRRFFRKAGRTPQEQLVSATTPLTPTRPGEDADIHALRAAAFSTSPVAQIVVDAQDRLALMNHQAGNLLSLTERDLGRPFQDLEVSFRPAELRSQLSTVRDNRTSIWLRDVEWHRSPNERLVLDIQLVALTDARSRLHGVAIIFNDVSRFRQLQDELEASNRQLETAYEELQSTNEELETTNEELQSTVEELETTNEELQSTNEELETMNEELQSMNDELQATNEELRDRTSEISTLNQFMESILGSLGTAVIVVSREMLVQVWNRQAEELWGLREGETVGQHFLNLDSGLPTEQVRPMIREVISGGSPTSEQRIHAINRRGRGVELRITATPLLSSDEEPAGALLVMEQVSPTGRLE